MCHDVGHTSDSSPSPQEREKPLDSKKVRKEQSITKEHASHHHIPQ